MHFSAFLMYFMLGLAGSATHARPEPLAIGLLGFGLLSLAGFLGSRAETHGTRTRRVATWAACLVCGCIAMFLTAAAIVAVFPD